MTETHVAGLCDFCTLVTSGNTDFKRAAALKTPEEHDKSLIQTSYALIYNGKSYCK